MKGRPIRDGFFMPHRYVLLLLSLMHDGIEAFERREGNGMQERKNVTNDREMVRSGNFAQDLETLRAEGRLEKEIDRVKHAYEERIQGSNSFMDQKAWEAFTIIDLFHPETAEHCVETLHLAREKMESALHGSNQTAGESAVIFSKIFNMDRNALNVFYRACLLHDIGKVNVSYEIITNTASDQDVAKVLYLHINEYGRVLKDRHLAIIANPDKLLEALKRKNTRPNGIVRAVDILSPESATILRRRGIDVDNKTLPDIIREHEEQSQKILEALGMAGESWIAGHHHDYKNELKEIPVEIHGVRVLLAEILHLADVIQAMTGKRGYKKPHTKLGALDILVDQAMHKMVDPNLTALWVRDEMDRVEPLSAEDAALLETESYKNLPPELQHRKKILGFLEKNNKVRIGDRIITIDIPKMVA